MNNHVLGFFISGLIHVGVMGFAINLDTPQKPEPTKSNTMLMVSMFQEKQALPSPVKPSKPIKPIEKLDTPQPKKIIAQPAHPKTIPEIIPEIIKPPVEIAPVVVAKALSPAPQIETKPVLEPKPTAKPKPTAPVIKEAKKETKKKPKRVVKKQITKKKVVKKSKKKPLPKKTVRTVRKTVKKKPVARKYVKRVIKKQVKRKPQKIVRKTKPLPKSRPQTKAVHARKQRPPTNYKNTARVVRAPQNAIRQHTRRPQSKPIARPQTAKKAIPTPQSINLTKQYKARLQQLIAKHKRYPKRAKRRNQQGRVTVSFKVTHSGNISNIRIIRSSNNTTLDDSAIQAIKQSSGKLPYLPKMSKKQLSLNITLSYVLK